MSSALRLAWALALMVAAVVAAILGQEDDRDELAEQAAEMFEGER